MEMIVLRSNGPVVDRYTVPASAHDADALSIGIETWGGKDLVDMRSDPTVVGAAPPMPTYLIKGLDDAPAAPVACAGGMSWGIKAVGADKSKFSGAGVTVAVLDTGIDRSHPAFENHGIDFVACNFTKDGDVDTDGHGTHCAGTIFGRDTSGCRIGVARGVTRALIGKVIGAGGGTTASIFRAILWAAQNGAHVISMSLGMDFAAYRQRLIAQGRPEQAATSMALAAYGANLRLFDDLSRSISSRHGVMSGVVVVAATGNESARPDYRVEAVPPARSEYFVGVAALGLAGVNANQALTIAAFSNTGARFAAPGVGIVSARLGGGLAAKSGTSMATPHVAGVAALWAEKLSGSGRPFSAARVIQEMERAAQTLPDLDPEDVGLGLVQAP